MSRICHLILAVIACAMFAPAVLRAQVYTDLHDFNCTLEGCGALYPAIMAQGRDGNLYGTLEQGGTSSMGTVFRIDALWSDHDSLQLLGARRPESGKRLHST